MKKSLILLVALTLSLIATAQSSLFSFGLRGGSCLYLTETPIQSDFGYQGLFDLGYTCLWPTFSCEVGLKTGISVGYSAMSLNGHVTNQFTNTDYLGYTMQYKTHANHKQQIQQIQAEVPLMFALRSNGFVWNIGAVLMMPVMNQYTQTTTNTYIDAYYPKTDVHVPNELITGKTANEYISNGKNVLPLFNVLVGTELGYEWQWNRHCLGLQFYYNFAPWCSHETSNRPLIEVAAICDPNYPPAEITVHPLTDTMCKMYYMDFGLKIYYAFSIKKF